MTVNGKKWFLTGGSGFIGTNLVESLVNRNATILNYDLLRPYNRDHADFWEQGDVLDLGALRKAVSSFEPDVLVHLAARTDCDENTTVEKGYEVNTRGTSNVLEAIEDVPSLRRLVIVSLSYRLYAKA